MELKDHNVKKTVTMKRAGEVTLLVLPIKSPL